MNPYMFKKSKLEILNIEIKHLKGEKEKINERLKSLIQEKAKINEQDDWLYLQSPGGEDCSEGDGICSCIFRISKKEWLSYGKILRKNKLKYQSIELDHSNGGHGCVLQYDLVDMYENTVEVFTTSVISEQDFDLISCDVFLEFLRDRLEDEL